MFLIPLSYWGEKTCVAEALGAKAEAGGWERGRLDPGGRA